MALAGCLQQLMLIWGGGGVVTVQYVLPIKPNAGIINPLPFGGISSYNPSAKIQTYNPSGRIKSSNPLGGISNIIPNAR